MESVTRPRMMVDDHDVAMNNKTANNATSTSFHDTGLHHLPLRTREARHHSDMPMSKFPSLSPRKDARARRIPESLQIAPGAFRLRSPTESSMSSISSANLPDSATTHSLSTLASPVSTSYASSIHEMFAATCLDDPRPKSRVLHRHQPSNGTCSTFVNDEDDGPVLTGYPDLDLKIRRLEEPSPTPAPIHLAPPPPQPISPATEAPVQEYGHATPIDTRDDDSVIDLDLDEEPAALNSDAESTTSDDLSKGDADLVLGYVLQLVYGIDLNQSAIPRETLYPHVASFVQNLDQHVWQSGSDNNRLSNNMSTSSSSSSPSNEGSGGEGQRGGKRKKQQGRREDDGDEVSDGEGSGFLPSKKMRPSPREEENLRLSCPFRKRNPHRFNVRDHHSCAMTYFPKFAELRQHIVKQHKRDDPSAFVCDRCNRDFSTRKDLRDHQRQPKELMCDITDNDTEAGIDGPTATKLLSRKRASGSSTQVQWREIWNILFPDDDDCEVKPYEYTPVIEHFELSNSFLFAFEQLQSSLRDKISNPQTLETLAAKFEQCFVETIDRCTDNAQSMPYTNRSNKKNETIRAQNTQSFVQKKGREVQRRPDSGVVMDDGSEESGSVMGMAVGLSHRESVRTVRGPTRRGSGVPETVREVLPATVMPRDLDEALLQQQQQQQQQQQLQHPPEMSPPVDLMGSTAMDPAAVQAWSNSVIYPPVTDVSMGLGDQFLAPTGLTPQAELMNWPPTMYQPEFSNMGHGFTGFHST